MKVSSMRLCADLLLKWRSPPDLSWVMPSWFPTNNNVAGVAHSLVHFEMFYYNSERHRFPWQHLLYCLFMTQLHGTGKWSSVISFHTCHKQKTSIKTCGIHDKITAYHCIQTMDFDSTQNLKADLASITQHARERWRTLVVLAGPECNEYPWLIVFRAEFRACWWMWFVVCGLWWHGCGQLWVEAWVFAMLLTHMGGICWLHAQIEQGLFLWNRHSWHSDNVVKTNTCAS